MQKIHGQLQKIFIFSILLGLNACYSTSNSILPESKKVDYQSARPASTLEVPPDLSQITQDEGKNVPESQGRGMASLLDYQNERLDQTQKINVLPQVEKVKMVREGNVRYLSVYDKPENLWKTLKSFWEETGFVLEKERADIGIMETNWAENRAKLPDDLIRKTLGRFLDSFYSTGERDKFRTRLEPSLEQGYTDIFITHRGMQEVYTSSLKEDTRWQARPADTELEAEMLRRLMLRLGLKENQAQQTMAQAKTTLPKQEKVAQNQVFDFLTLPERFDRAWRRVGLALDRSAFTVEDRDRKAGIYFVRYVDRDWNAPEKSWAEKLAFWKKSPEQSTQYRIYVKAENENQSTVQVLTKEGGEDHSPTAQKILKLLHAQLF